jgi:hypothetical protein
LYLILALVKQILPLQLEKLIEIEKDILRGGAVGSSLGS